MIVPGRRIARRPHQRHAGLTLVEVLVAVSILSIAIVVYTDVVLMASNSTKKASNLTIATRAAGDQIAVYQDTDASTLTNGTTTSSVAGLVNGSMTVVISAPGSASSATNLKQVDVTVTWSGQGGTNLLGGRVKMTTIVSALK